MTVDRRAGARWGVARRVVASALVLAGAFVAAGVALAATASAHSQLETTDPVQGSEVATSPAAVTLSFSESISFGPQSLEVLDPSGHRVDRGDPHHLSGRAATITVDLPAGLAKASYAVVWRIVSADSHPVSGTFSFGVGVAAGSPPPPAPVDETTVVTHTVLQALSYLALVLLVGVTGFLYGLWPTGLRVAAALRLQQAGWACGVVATLGLLVVQGPFGAGLSLGAATDTALLSQTVASPFGRLVLLRLLALLVALSVIALPRRRRETARPLERSDLVNAAGIGLVLLLSFALTGHAGQGRPLWLTVGADIVHLLAASLWLGGLAVLAVAFLPAADASDRARVLPLWSRTAMACVAAIVVTGTYQAYREVGSLDALTGTDFGHLLIAKLVGLAALLALGDSGRRWVRRHAAAAVGDAAVALRRLRETVFAESAVGVGVLGVTAVLVGSVPAVQAFAPPYSASLTGQGTDGQISVIVDIDPTRVGAQTVHVYTYSVQGRVLPFISVNGTLTEKGGALGPVRFAFADTGPGHATSEGVVVPAAGLWTLTTQVRTDAFTSYAASATYQVK